VGAMLDRVGAVLENGRKGVRDGRSGVGRGVVLWRVVAVEN
jgi:hypothetical protein